MQSSIRRGLVAVLSVMSLLLGLTAVASADNVNVDGDGVVPVDTNAISLGTVCANSTVTRSVLIGIRRTGGDNQSFQNGTSQTISFAGPASITGATVTATFPDGTTAVPGNWLTGVGNNTIADNTATAAVTFQIGTVAGPISGSLSFNAAGTSGNNVPLTRSGSVTVTGTVQTCDNTPPVITKTVTGTAGANGWYTSNVTVSWTVTDPESSVTVISGCDNQMFSTETAAATSSCKASSAGGTSEDSMTIKIDKTGPTATLTPAGTLGDNGWYTSDVTVSTSGADSISGPVACTSNQTLTDETNGQMVDGSCTNNAGLRTDAATLTVKIDKTKPTVSVTGITQPTYTLGSVPAAGCSTTDALSGVASQASLSSSGGSVGSITATCSGGSDNAGNPGASASVTYSVVYAWSGFRQPVDNLPTLNKAKAGSAIPVKFSLAGNQGLNIFAAGFPKSTTVTCGNTAADDIEETATAGSSSLSYDATADQYVYVWKTDKGWANTCRTLTVTLVDGTTHQANFQFTK